MPSLRAFLTAFLILVVSLGWAIQQFESSHSDSMSFGENHQNSLWAPSMESYWDWNEPWNRQAGSFQSGQQHIFCLAAEELINRPNSQVAHYADELRGLLHADLDGQNYSLVGMGIPQGCPLLYSLFWQSKPDIAGSLTIIMLVNEKSVLNNIMIQRYANRNAQGQIVGLPHPATQGKSLLARYPWLENSPLLSKMGRQFFDSLFLKNPKSFHQDFDLLMFESQLKQSTVQRALSSLESVFPNQSDKDLDIKFLYVPYDAPTFRSQLNGSEWKNMQRQFIAQLSEWTRQRRWELIDVQAFSHQEITSWYQTQNSLTPQAHEQITQILQQQLLARVAMSTPHLSEEPKLKERQQ